MCLATGNGETAVIKNHLVKAAALLGNKLFASRVCVPKSKYLSNLLSSDFVTMVLREFKESPNGRRVGLHKSLFFERCKNPCYIVNMENK